jgi:hypothetical protein
MASTRAFSSGPNFPARAFLFPVGDGPGHAHERELVSLEDALIRQISETVWPRMGFDLSVRVVETIPFPCQGQAILPIQSFEIEAFDLGS